MPGGKSLLAKDIDFTDEITLKYNQNVISFDFTALDYHSGGNVFFSYYMDGFESNWRSAGNQRSTTYTNLHPGHYTFRIKAANLYNYSIGIKKEHQNNRFAPGMEDGLGLSFLCPDDWIVGTFPLSIPRDSQQRKNVFKNRKNRKGKTAGVASP